LSITENTTKIHNFHLLIETASDKNKLIPCFFYLSLSKNAFKNVVFRLDLLQAVLPSNIMKIDLFHLKILNVLNPNKKISIGTNSIHHSEQYIPELHLPFPCITTYYTVAMI
jgi:hypothetical protein